MKGSYLAGIIESELLREQRMKNAYARKKYVRENCSNCKNKTTDLCHIVQTVDGRLKCVNYEVNNESCNQ